MNDKSYKMNKYISDCINFSISFLKRKYVLYTTVTIGVIIGLLIGGIDLNKKYKNKAAIKTEKIIHDSSQSTNQ